MNHINNSKIRIEDQIEECVRRCFETESERIIEEIKRCVTEQMQDASDKGDSERG